MNALALAVALFSVSTAPVLTNASVTTAASVTASKATAAMVAFADPDDQMPKCFPYCK